MGPWSIVWEALKKRGEEFVHISGSRGEGTAEISCECQSLSRQRCPCTPRPFTSKTLINPAVENHISTFLNNYHSQQRNDIIPPLSQNNKLALNLYTTKANSVCLTDGNEQTWRSWWSFCGLTSLPGTVSYPRRSQIWTQLDTVKSPEPSEDF